MPRCFLRLKQRKINSIILSHIKFQETSPSPWGAGTDLSLLTLYIRAQLFCGRARSGSVIFIIYQLGNLLSKNEDIYPIKGQIREPWKAVFARCSNFPVTIHSITTIWWSNSTERAQKLLLVRVAFNSLFALKWRYSIYAFHRFGRTQPNHWLNELRSHWTTARAINISLEERTLLVQRIDHVGTMWRGQSAPLVVRTYSRRRRNHGSGTESAVSSE